MLTRAQAIQQAIKIVEGSERPLTAGEVTRTINFNRKAADQIKRSAVKSLLDDLVEAGRIGAVMAKCWRNKREVVGRHYLKKAAASTADPFAGLEEVR